jgi:hypothetical protein
MYLYNFCEAAIIVKKVSAPLFEYTYPLQRVLGHTSVRALDGRLILRPAH